MLQVKESQRANDSTASQIEYARQRDSVKDIDEIGKNQDNQKLINAQIYSLQFSDSVSSESFKLARDAYNESVKQNNLKFDIDNKALQNQIEILKTQQKNFSKQNESILEIVFKDVKINDFKKTIQANVSIFNYKENPAKITFASQVACFDVETSNCESMVVSDSSDQWINRYVSFGKEHAKGRSAGDLKEFWHFGQYVSEGSKWAGEYPDNVEVTELPKFNEVGKEAYKMLEKTGIYVLRALAIHIGLDEFYFDNYIKDGNSILRPIHYPPITDEPKDGAVRAAAHGDINLITLLMGAQGKGLQVQNHDGEWIDAMAQPDELMINVGDMLSRHTNNKLKSTIHQVVNPPRELWGTSRYSIPFFMHPVSDMKLNCLEQCIDANNPKLYDDITAGEFLDERLVELGLKKK